MTIINCRSITCQHFILLTRWSILTKAPKGIVRPSPVRIRCRGENVGTPILLNGGGVCVQAAGVLGKKKKPKKPQKNMQLAVAKTFQQNQLLVRHNPMACCSQVRHTKGP